MFGSVLRLIWTLLQRLMLATCYLVARSWSFGEMARMDVASDTLGQLDFFIALCFHVDSKGVTPVIRPRLEIIGLCGVQIPVLRSEGCRGYDIE